jgi:transcriptional regulator GlxA family with amidase domain
MSATAPDSASLQRHIVVLVYPGVMAMDVCGPMDAFAMANYYADRGLYRLSIAALTADPVKTSIGFCSGSDVGPFNTNSSRLNRFSCFVAYFTSYFKIVLSK